MSFIDRGTGFKPDLGERLFEAFYTTKPQGLGLGLSISRSIVAAHGGRLWGVTIGGQGATFHLVLPALDAGP
jgi:signal transduction histidine kinase